ncbi:SubName: Full=Uncharacterized protein {ECO:0000313/EMBL:CCA76405.1}; Flags: Fragment [Serendipita indica DSM 11827]|nr:SubName: Full=Uncharacterized protein {ECO:0000313/EMBL:CCA76405.1}; Flags: Fragment [Serendipita indica DSM 11827]
MSSIRARRPTWGKENRSENHNRINLGSSSMHSGRSYEPLSDPERTRRWDQYASDLDEFIQDSNEPPHASPFRIKFDNTLYEDEDEYEEEYDSTAIKIEEAEESDILTRLRSFSRPYGSPHELDPQAKRVYPSLSKDTFIQRLSSPKALQFVSDNRSFAMAFDPLTHKLYKHSLIPSDYIFPLPKDIWHLFLFPSPAFPMRIEANAAIRLAQTEGAFKGVINHYMDTLGRLYTWAVFTTAVFLFIPAVEPFAFNMSYYQ